MRWLTNLGRKPIQFIDFDSERRARRSAMLTVITLTKDIIPAMLVGPEAVRGEYWTIEAALPRTIWIAFVNQNARFLVRL
jgi:hypothetical protein